MFHANCLVFIYHIQVEDIMLTINFVCQYRFPLSHVVLSETAQIRSELFKQIMHRI